MVKISTKVSLEQKPMGGWWWWWKKAGTLSLDVLCTLINGWYSDKHVVDAHEHQQLFICDSPAKSTHYALQVNSFSLFRGQVKAAYKLIHSSETHQ